MGSAAWLEIGVVGAASRAESDVPPEVITSLAPAVSSDGGGTVHCDSSFCALDAAWHCSAAFVYSSSSA